MNDETVEEKPHTATTVSDRKQRTDWPGRNIHLDCTLDLGAAGKSSLPEWCRSMGHVLQASLEPDGTICFYKRRRRSGTVTTHLELTNP